MNLLQSDSRIEASQNVKFSDLTNSQRERALYWSSIFGDASASLVYLLDVRGKNSFLAVDAKLKFIKEAPYEVETYHNFILDNFEIGTVYSKEEILTTIAEVRRDLGMSSPVTRLKATCEADFACVFLFDEVYQTCNTLPDGKKRFENLVGYMPTFKLKSQD